MQVFILTNPLVPFEACSLLLNPCQQKLCMQHAPLPWSRIDLSPMEQQTISSQSYIFFHCEQWTQKDSQVHQMETMHRAILTSKIT